MGEPLRVDELREAIRSMTDEECDRVVTEMVKDGILDEEGNVLKRFPPEPPDWLMEAARPPAPVPNPKRRKRS